MTTVGLYGNSPAGVVAAASGSESTGLYGNNVSFGGSYFEWFIFTQADTQPATPTGGSWDFTTNAGTPPNGWSAVPPSAPTNKVWVSIALVSSKNTSSLVWSAPGLFSYSSGLPILSGNGIPASGAGVSDQLYIQLDTAPQTIWFKESGTWTRLTGSSLYVDLTSNQTIAGTKTFSSTIQGSVSGTSSNVTGTVGIVNGGTGSTTASGARAALGAAASGANSDITSLSGLTTPLSVFQGGTGASTASGARSNLGSAASGANSDITSLSGITGGISTADFLQLDTAITPAPAVAKLQWDTTWNGPQIGMGGGNVNLQIGQETLIYVYNNTGSALTDGQIVYVTGSQGQRVTVALAQANSDSTSATIIGMVTEPIANGASGFVTTQGMVSQINTIGAADGAVVYLSPTTAGAWTTTKPQAPDHMVMVGYVVKGGSGGAGSIYIHPQNGYELDELHDVKITSRAAYNLLQVDPTNTYWQNVAGPTGAVVGTTDAQTLTNKTISGASNTLSNIPTSVLTGTLGIANGGTGQTTANAAFNALAPSQTGNSGKFLTTDGTNTSWATNPLGTVTSVGGTGTVSGITLSGTVTTSGNLTLGGALDLSSPPAIGGTTPNSGAFTTLSASGNVTLFGGTANGVAYLNASKVLTSGSALTFDGTNLGVGTGANTLGAFIAEFNGSGTTATARFSDTFAQNGFEILGASTVLLTAYNRTTSTWLPLRQRALQHEFYISGSEQMRLTSTGLGIGTSSPKVKLQTVGETSGFPTLGTSAGGLFVSSNNGLYGLYGGVNGSTGDTWLQAMRNDSALAYNIVLNPVGGNLGLGVTPSAFDSPWRVLQITPGSGYNAPTVLACAYDSTYLFSNAVYTSGFKYIANNYATQYQQYQGAHKWYTAPSGTAGNAISFTQAMTLDASGNLLVAQTGQGPANSYSMCFGAANTGGLDLNHVSGAASGVMYARFNYNATTIGSITQNGTTGVLYNLTSDYRLKNNPVPVTGAKEFINALQPKTWDWWDGSGKGVGFIAHEFMEVAKYSGNGTKDAVDDDGNPVYQSIQPSSSEVMANLVAYVQELRAEFDAYKATHP